jgi:3-oxoacyl-[acyl-carrier protein] reductase
MLLDHKVALVTGTGTGIGQEIARLFTEPGARLVLLDKDAEANQAAAYSLDPSGQRAIAVKVDVRNRPGIDASARSLPGHRGPKGYRNRTATR